MDSWYASMKVMKAIDRLSKIYYVPHKQNRLVNDTEGVEPYKAVKDVSWLQAEKRQGKRVHLKNFPMGSVVKLFRFVSDKGRTEYIVTNDLTQSSVNLTHQKCRLRWKIELLHREMKQVTGIGKCQCRKMRAQRNHIACSFQVWIVMMRAARAVGQTIYYFKDS